MPYLTADIAYAPALLSHVRMHDKLHDLHEPISRWNARASKTSVKSAKNLENAELQMRVRHVKSSQILGLAGEEVSFSLLNRPRTSPTCDFTPEHLGTFTGNEQSFALRAQTAFLNMKVAKAVKKADTTSTSSASSSPLASTRYVVTDYGVRSGRRTRPVYTDTMRIQGGGDECDKRKYLRYSDFLHAEVSAR